MKLDETVWVDLPNEAALGLPVRFYRANLPVFFSPSGSLQGRDGSKIGAGGDADPVGSAFSVFPGPFGILVTAAHVLPVDLDEALAKNQVGVLFFAGDGKGVMFPFKQVVVDAANDVAVCVTPYGPDPHRPAWPFLPLAPSLPLDGNALVAFGYPNPICTDKSVDLQPTHYFGETFQGRREPARFTADDKKRGSLLLDGQFIQVPMKALPGLSGGSLCAFRRGKPTVVGKGRERRLQEALEMGAVVGVMSASTKDPDPTFARGYFADIEAALRLKLPAPFNRTLREVLSEVTPSHEVALPVDAP